MCGIFFLNVGNKNIYSILQVTYSINKINSNISQHHTVSVR